MNQTEEAQAKVIDHELSQRIKQRVDIIRAQDAYSKQTGHAQQLGFLVEQHAETILHALAFSAQSAPVSQEGMVFRSHLEFLANLYQDKVHKTESADRVFWDGEWYEGPLATAFLRLVEEVSQAARAMLSAADATPEKEGHSAGDGSEVASAASMALMYLETGFVECPQCGHEVQTNTLDAVYELRGAGVAPAAFDGGKNDAN